MTRVTTALVGGLVDAQFPRWAHLPLEPVKPGGWDNRSFRLGPGLLVRVPRSAAYAAQVPVEQAWLPRLAAGLRLAIPAPVALGVATEALPWAWSVYRWIEGEPLSQVPGADRTRLALDLAGFLAALHACDAEGAPGPGLDNFHRGGDPSAYAPEVEAALFRLGAAADAPAARRLWDRALASRWTGPTVWFHGDVAPGNLLLRNGRLAAVIDWGQARAGDPACDLAFAWGGALDPLARCAFREALPLDPGTWDRGAGWALWKALVVVAELPGTDPAQRPAAAATLAALPEE